MNKNFKYSFILLLVSIIWGFAFAFQSIGGESLGPFTFFAFRNYFAVATMFAFFIFIRKDDDLTDNPYSIRLGLYCGIIEFAASVLQQVSVTNTTAANTSFITAMYVVLVPVFAMIFFGKKTNIKTWLCIGLEIIGMYLLCVKEGFAINKGDFYAIGCAILFAYHIICIDRGGQKLDTILFCFVQFGVCAVLATICMFLFERPIIMTNVKDCLIPLAYTGVLSSSVCITLQVTCQKHLDPSIASLIMCLESVFGAVGGWLLLQQYLSVKELMGCAIMFIAIVISQLANKEN